MCEVDGHELRLYVGHSQVGQGHVVQRVLVRQARRRALHGGARFHAVPSQHLMEWTERDDAYWRDEERIGVIRAARVIRVISVMRVISVIRVM